MDNASSRIVKTLKLFYIDPSEIITEGYFNEEFEAMATSMTSAFPNTAAARRSNYLEFYEHPKFEKSSHKLKTCNKKSPVSCSTSQLTDSFSDINQGSLGTISKFRKGVCSWMKFKTNKENETVSGFPFWKGFTSRKSKLSFSALSLSSNNHKKANVLHDGSHILTDAQSHDKLAAHSSSNHSENTKKHNTSWYDLSRSQSCQLISRKSKSKKNKSCLGTDSLATEQNSGSCDLLQTDDSVRKNVPIFSKQSKNPKSCSQFVSMDDILDSLPHIDSSSSDDEDFRRRTLNTNVARERPVSISLGNSRMERFSVSESIEHVITCNEGLNANWKRRRPYSLIPEINLCSERLVIPEVSEDIQFNPIEFGSTSECKKLKADCQKVLLFSRSSQVNDIRSSVRLRAKAFTKRAKELTNKIQKSPKEIWEAPVEKVENDKLCNNISLKFNENTVHKTQTSQRHQSSPRKRRKKAKASLRNQRHDSIRKTLSILQSDEGEPGEIVTQSVSVSSQCSVFSRNTEESPDFGKGVSEVEKGVPQGAIVTDEPIVCYESTHFFCESSATASVADPCLTLRDISSSEESVHQSRSGEFLLLS